MILLISNICNSYYRLFLELTPVTEVSNEKDIDLQDTEKSVDLLHLTRPGFPILAGCCR